MAREIRFGICGAGSFGCTRARALAQLDGGHVIAGWSRSTDTRGRFGDEFGAATPATWQDLCAHPEVDALLICTPNAEHGPQARAALGAGKHVLVETPLALSAAEAHGLAEVAAANGLVLHHGAKWRYHPDQDAYIDGLRQVGPLLFGMEQAAFDFGPDRRWYMNEALTGGARTFLPYVLVDWLEAFGPVDGAVGAVGRQDTWSSAAVTLTFASGGHATMGYALGLGIPEVSTRHIVGVDGFVSAEAGAPPVLTQGERRTEIARRPVDIVAWECQAFVDEIRGERDHLAPLDLDLRAWDLVDEALG